MSVKVRCMNCNGGDLCVFDIDEMCFCGDEFGF